MVGSHTLRQMNWYSPRLFLGLAFLAGSVAHAQNVDEDQAQQELQSVEEGLQLSAEKREALEAELKQSAQALEGLSQQLISVTATIQTKEYLLTRIDQQVASLGSERRDIETELDSKRAVLGEVLAGLQRLEQNPPPALVVAPGDVLGALRGAMMFGAIVPEMKDEANQLIGKLQRLKAITAEQDQQKETLKLEFASLEKSRDELDLLLLQKKQMSLATEQELANEAKLTDQMGQRAKSLKQLLTSIAAIRSQEEALKSAERRMKEQELERQRQALLSRPRLVMSRAKGQLDFPVQGMILRDYGDTTASGSKLGGVAIATRTFAQVKSPVDGKIEFAGPFRSYGKLIIINPGEGYLVVLAGLAQVSTTNGQSVRAGEPLGEMGDKPASTTVSGGATQDGVDKSAPVLYVEFRKQGQPIDPSAWWIGNRKEAMR
jgi:murein hydrolase activator